MKTSTAILLAAALAVLAAVTFAGVTQAFGASAPTQAPTGYGMNGGFHMGAQGNYGGHQGMMGGYGGWMGCGGGGGH